MSIPPAAAQQASADIRPDAGLSGLRCSGAWVLRWAPELERQLAALALPAGSEVAIDAAEVTAMDAAGAWLLHRTLRALEAQGRNLRVQGLRPEFATLLALIAAGAPAPGAMATAAPGPLASTGC